MDTPSTGTPLLTYSHHAELHLLLHGDVLIVLWVEEGALDRAAVCPGVIVGDIVHVNGSHLNVTALCPMPLQTVIEVLMEDVRNGVVIVENLGEATKRHLKKG